MLKKRLAYAAGLAAVTLSLTTTCAQAGFEWVAPSSPAATAPAPAPVYASPQQPLIIEGAPPVATAAPEVISPVIISGTPSAPVDAAPQNNQNNDESQTSVVSSSPAAVPPPSTDLATATISMPASSASGVVQGFAAQIPLALALRQILPSGYNFSIDQGVDMDTLVSYKGGLPWQDTLSAMLTPLGLAFHQQGDDVTITHMVAAAAAPAPAAPAVVPLSAPAPQVVSAATDALPMVNVGAPEGWSAERGDTLRKVLANWCARDGVQLQWLAEYDYPLEASADFSGSFENAVRQLLAGFATAQPQPVAALHTNAGAGQKVLVVQARGNT